MSTLIQKRFKVTMTTSMMINLMTELMPSKTKDELVEAAILYGLAYINETNKLKLAQWTDKLELPTIESVEDLLGQRAGVDNGP